MQIIAAVTGCLVLAASGYGQELTKGRIETTGQVGLAMGVGTRASFAGTVGLALTDRLFVLGEVGYIPLGGTSASGSSPLGSFDFSAGGKLWTFMAGAQYQFDSQRSFVPYAGAAVGFVDSSADFESSLAGSAQNISTSRDDFYVSFGGGARYYIKDRWGFKPEFMVFAGDDTFFRLGIGMFYQFGQ